MTAPLRLDQVAPRAFLLVEKLVVLALGPGELSLRLFPLLDLSSGSFADKPTDLPGAGGSAFKCSSCAPRDARAKLARRVSASLSAGEARAVHRQAP